MYIGEIILNYRNSFNPKLSQRAFASRTSLSPSYINTLEKIYNPKTGKPYSVTTDVAIDLANAMNMSIEDLLSKLNNDQEFVTNNIDKNIHGMEKKSEGSAVVLVYGTIPAGTPIECIEDIIDTEEIPVEMLKGGKQYFGLKVKGNSMYPEYLDGDTLILLKQEDCESGDDAVIMVNGNDGTFKRVIKDEEKQTIRLQPLNTTLDENGNFLYEPITFTKEQIEQLPVRIIGVVEEIRRKKKRK